MRPRRVSKAGWFLEKQGEWIDKIPSVRPGPYFHVSGLLGSREETEAVFTGENYGYMRLGGHLDMMRVEQWLCGFEHGAAFRFRADGMSAIAPVLHAVAETRGKGKSKRRGRGIIRVLPLYGGTFALIEKLRRVYDFCCVDLYAEDPYFLRNLKLAMGVAGGAVIFEVAGNPTITIPDVEGIVSVCRDHPLRPVTICDNTFFFGLFHPFEWGVDMVCASDTKYLGGESAFLAGHCGVSHEFLERDPKFWQAVNEWADCGGTPGPFESWLVARFSITDIEERITLHSMNARVVAEFLAAHPHVGRINYPGLSGDFYHERARRYLRISEDDDDRGAGKFGGMIAFYPSWPGARVEEFLYHLNANSHFGNKASLGGPDDMISSPYLLTHAHVPEQIKFGCDITPNLLRLSVGRVRDPGETIEALARSFDAVFGQTSRSK